MSEPRVKLADFLVGVKKLGIAGHVRPDGDCVGSCMGLYLYITENYPDIETHVYMEEPKGRFDYIKAMDKVEETVVDTDFDLFIAIDLSNAERIGVAGEEYVKAKKTLCIDHHVSNTKFGMVNHVIPTASSSCEVLYDMLEEEKISEAAATAIYTGIVHDSGVFKYENTSEHTMNIAGKLMSKGVNFPAVIDEGFYEKSYVQNQILGRALLESILLLKGKCIYSAISQSEMKFYGVTQKEMGGIVEQLRLTAGVDVAIFMYEISPMEYKVSLRSKKYVDCNVVAGYFGGGGHVRAAGCILKGTKHDVVNNLLEHIEQQLEEKDVLHNV
ncbi:MAG: bifunctional oligoribonuclease/PAP phosphatase NrnA [Lachnospiraceae bacterium]